MSMAKVTICIPAYNAGEFIAESLESIQRQTWGNLEIIVGDNCSTDNTVEVVSRVQSRDNRVHLLRHESNTGFAGNLNRLLAAAATEYIAFFHADDIYQPTIVAREMAVLLENEQLAGVFSKACYFRTGEAVGPPQKQKFLGQGVLRRGKDYFWGGLEEFLPLMLQHGNVFVCPTFLCRRASFAAAGAWEARYPGLEDVYMWIRFLASGSSLAIIPEGLIHYRVHGGSDTSAFTAKAPGHMKEMQHRLLDDFIREHQLQVRDEYQSAYCRRKARELLNIAKAYLDRGEQEQFYAYVKRSHALYRYPFYDKRFIQQRLPKLYASINKGKKN
jgi:glycosyltransferase involved in cell wall biosynthesis